MQGDQLVRECLDQIRGYDANFSALIGERCPFRSFGWACESVPGDWRVVNFEQILFANRRMLDLDEPPAQRVRAFNFDRIPSRVSVALASKQSSERSPPMQLPSILQRESRTRLLQGAFAGFLATVIIGFGWGGWTLGSTARETAAKSAAAAVVAVLAPMCADKFRQTAEASANMTELKKVSSWMQDSYIEKGGWATFPGMSSPDRGVAQACATLLTTVQ